MRAIGKKKVDFTSKDGTPIRGLSLYVTEDIPPDQGEGQSAERIFLSERLLAGLGFTPEVGMDLDVLYNRFGKVQSLRRLDAPLDFGS